MLEPLQRGLKLIEALKTVHADFPPNGLAIFLSLINKEGVSCTELVEDLDMPKATVSRNLRMLGPMLSPHKEGMKLVNLIHDPDDYRVRRAYLSKEGKKFAQKIQEALS